MSFFIGVVFACLNDSCVFFKAKENFDNQEKCEAVVRTIIKEVKDKADIADGSCLPIKVNMI